MIDRGQGLPIVLVPGIQGRWEWMAPAVEALARRSRVLTGSLCGEPGSGCHLDPSIGLDNYTRQIDSWLDEAGLAAAAVCGVSYGGLIAARFAAARAARVTSLILVSTPSPTWRPDARLTAYARRPLASTLRFIAGAPFRLLPEILTARRGLVAPVAFATRHLCRVVAAPMSPRRATERLRLVLKHDGVADGRGIAAPTLLLTGEPGLDRVVPPDETREYLRLVRGAEARVLERTGHIGLVTRPDAFAEIVVGFVGQACAAASQP